MAKAKSGSNERNGASGANGNGERKASPGSALIDSFRRTATDVATGAEGQLQSLRAAVDTAGRMVDSMRETDEQAESVSTAAQELAASANELSASVEQVTENTVELAT